MATTAEMFHAPSLSGLIQQAQDGQDTAPAAISRMEKALQAQLTRGPLTDLKSGALDGNGFVSEVQSLESSYEQDLDDQLSAVFPNVDEILKLQGQQVVANVIALNQQNVVGLISDTDLATDAQSAIDSLTDGAIGALDTPLTGYTSTTQDLVSDITDLAQSLSSTSSSSLTPAQAMATAVATTEAYQADVHAGLQVLHPHASRAVDAAVTALEGAETASAQEDASTAASQVTSALTAFDTAVLGTDGVFGSNGPVSGAFAYDGFAPNLTIPQAGSTMSGVSGTATPGGTATLTATLTSPSTGQGIDGATVSFTLDGAFAGVAVTNSSGVATLGGVPTSDAVGTDTGGVVASFSGNITFEPIAASGDLNVQAATALNNVSGTASYGGTASLTATLTSTSTGQGVANETISFTLDGTSVGTAVTDSDGVATLTGVATSDAAGTDTGGVAVSFAGVTDYGASSGTGNLVVTS